nr:hypothetical protein CFP56_31697 [Quercus suber]
MRRGTTYAVRVAGPCGEWHRLTATTKDGEREDENEHLGPTIQCGRYQVVVLDKELRVVFPDIKLRREADDEEGREGAVDPYEQVAHEPQDDREVDVAESAPAGVLVQKVKRDRNDEANQEA